jgi:hypothetical protein
MTHKIEWIDRGFEPTQPPDKNFPDGVDVDLRSNRLEGPASCGVKLPYPAARCGYFLIVCEDCGLRVTVTTAGRPDDPRSASFSCRSRSTR